MKDDWNPKFRLSDGPVAISLIPASVPGTRQIIGNRGEKPLVIREVEGIKGLENRFVFPAGVTEIVVPPHGTATFVAERPSRWQRLWCWLTRRGPALRWRYQPLEKDHP